MAEPPQLNKLFEIDGQLEQYKEEIVRRFGEFQKVLNVIEQTEGLDQFTRAYENFGLVIRADNSILCREWAPMAKQLYLRGDFNGWKDADEEFAYKRTEFGKWELVIPPRDDGSLRIALGSFLKLQLRTAKGELADRLSPFSHYVRQDERTALYAQVFYSATHMHAGAYRLQHPHVPRKRSLRIYEAHVGIASDEPCIATYEHFRKNVLPRIVRLGYNAVQLMAIQEHAYYASFGYQVTSFYAPSSRFGPPDDLKRLIDECHAQGVMVLLDVVHSHASSNVEDGLNQFDGSNSCYFHDGPKGSHPLWGSRLFDYTNWEVLRFYYQTYATGSKSSASMASASTVSLPCCTTHTVVVPDFQGTTRSIFL